MVKAHAKRSHPARARELIEHFRQSTIDLVLTGLTGNRKPRPALRTAVKGWLGYIDAAILDWTEKQDLPRRTFRDLLLAAFINTLVAAQQADPKIQLKLRAG